MENLRDNHASIGTLPARRRWFDALIRGLMALGALAVVAAIVLMLLFLARVAAPLFQPAAIGPSTTLALPPGQAKLLHINRNGDAAFRIDESGKLSIFAINDGRELHSRRLGAQVVAAKPAFGSDNLYAALDARQRLWLLETAYQVSFQDGRRRLQPRIHLLFGGRPIEVGPLIDYDLRLQADGALLLATLSDGGPTPQCLPPMDGQAAAPDRRTGIKGGCGAPAASSAVLQVQAFPSQLTAADLQRRSTWRRGRADTVQRLWFGPRGKWLFTLGMDRLTVWPEAAPAGTFAASAATAQWRPAAVEALAGPVKVKAATPLLGRQSLLIADGAGGLSQWSLAQTGGEASLIRVRGFGLEAAPSTIIAEGQRKGFAVLDEAGNLSLGHATAKRILAQQPIELAAGTALALSPPADLLLALAPSGALRRIALSNPHPEVSWNALFGKVQYESYSAPVHSWQSTSADADFEPKFSLTPLLFGTLKAALYAMLFAAPVAVMGALYTACFMDPALRRWVKPAIEMMAALPTVVLGFLAGLWLAPWVEANLAALAALLLFLPGGMLLFAAVWSRLGEGLKKRCDGWQGLIAIVPLIGLSLAALHLAPHLEAAWLGGDAKTWLQEVHGLDYDQRNALVVGLAMGVAVIPLIFTIAEDAIFAVPGHLADASLALGATRWQTVTRVILLTASPGIFSALMIGFGRAVGETMIVLMAAGNTPIMDLSIFQGMRTLAANIAVELPESAVGSTHYRLLFLTALMLFAMTFAFNTLGDLVRERLRSRFGSL